jgi:hypothetical protein
MRVGAEPLLGAALPLTKRSSDLIRPHQRDSTPVGQLESTLDLDPGGFSGPGRVTVEGSSASSSPNTKGVHGAEAEDGRTG